MTVIIKNPINDMRGSIVGSRGIMLKYDKISNNQQDIYIPGISLLYPLDIKVLQLAYAGQIL